MCILCVLGKVQSQLIRSVEYIEQDKSKFITKPSDLSIHLFELRDSYGSIHIDFGRHQEQVILIRNSISVKLKLLFQIHASSPEIYRSLKHEFCYQLTVTSQTTCHKIPELNTNLILFRMDVTVYWLNDKTGFTLIIDPPNTNDYDLSGFYYIKAYTPESGMVLSNFLEIRDILFWRKNIITITPIPTKITYSKVLSINEIPTSFSCLDQVMSFNQKDLPFWINLEFRSIVKWGWCPVSKKVSNMMESERSYVDDCLKNFISKCEKPNYLCPVLSGKMPGWPEIISFNGALTLTGGKPFQDYGGKLNGYALLCYFESKNGYKALKYIANSYDSTEREFIKGLQWESRNKNTFRIEPISPINQIVHVGIFKKKFILTAFYYAPVNFTYEWSRQGKKLFNSNDWTVKPFELKFLSKITLEMEGPYYLRIRSYNHAIEFVINVKVISPPILYRTVSEPIHSTVYLMVNSNFSISFLYKANPTHANIYINGIMYRPGISNRKVFLNDLAHKSFNVKHLNFNFTENKLSEDITNFTYSVTNVLFPETLLRGQDHNLVVEVVNEYGVSRSTLNIYVLKQPKFENLPRYDNCTTFCSSLQPHLFRCDFNTEYYKIREVVIEKFWLVNDTRLDSLPYHKIYFEDDEKGLGLKPVKTDNANLDEAIKKLLKNAKLICRVRLLYPGSMNMTDSRLINDNRIIYDTFNDPLVMNHISAQIRLDWEPTIASASYTWIIFLAIAFILIVMFIFLLVKFTLRGQGKSYQIEKLEIAKGYNRDEEIIENETIKPYLRSANMTTRQTNHTDKNNSKGYMNSSLYSPLNGSTAFRPRDVTEIIDDEENAIDTSKFNEEGSFIGAYSNKSNHSTLPSEEKFQKF